jgi:alpha-amylase/alpha-mannosidase (GH57 family)
VSRFVCVHGHFYQPPRENPWLEEIELQESAHPYRNWNERICAECYAPNAASRILDEERRIIEIVNNYSRISFNFGPTLLAWMEQHQPNVYQAILEADRVSRERFSGHGSAIAQIYNHMIMPLANRSDKYSHATWGVRDFQRRFGRFPEGMWLPETAVDLETLEILAELGIQFTILAPHQARKVRLLENSDWEDVAGGKIDPSMPYLCRLPSGRSIALFFYDGSIARDLAFGTLLSNGEDFAARLLGTFSDERHRPQLVHVATDGETYGHHHRMGDMALAYCLNDLEARRLARVTVYGEFLEQHPPTREVEIIEGSSWSCSHGVERWRSNCGCHSGSHAGWSQSWRAPLRNAMNWLRDSLIPLFEREASQYLRDPWLARHHYIDMVTDRSDENREQFLHRHTLRELTGEERSRVLKLLELQRYTMLMYTSCGWFFDEISGLETTQVMKYAARAIQLAEELWQVQLEAGYLDFLGQAPSNIAEFDNGARVYELLVQPTSLDLRRVCAHYAVSSLFKEKLEDIRVYCYTAQNVAYSHRQAGIFRLGIGRTAFVSPITLDELHLSFAALHLGGHNVMCGIHDGMEETSFEVMQEELQTAFDLGDIPELIRILDRHFGNHSYSLWHLFKDEQRQVLHQILKSTMEGIEFSFRQTVEQNYTVMNFLKEIGMPMPEPFEIAAAFLVNADLARLFDEPYPNLERLEQLIEDTRRWSLALNAEELAVKASTQALGLLNQARVKSEDMEILECLLHLFQLLLRLKFELPLWEIQNAYFALARELLPGKTARAAIGESEACRWLEILTDLGDHIRVKVI